MLSSLEDMIKQIKGRDRNANIVVAGDFNNKLGVVRNRLLNFDLKPCIDFQEATHAKGSHLDEVFTNFKVDSAHVHPVNPHLSDHKAIQLVANINLNQESHQNLYKLQVSE